MCVIGVDPASARRLDLLQGRTGGFVLLGPHAIEEPDCLLKTGTVDDLLESLEADLSRDTDRIEDVLGTDLLTDLHERFQLGQTADDGCLLADPDREFERSEVLRFRLEGRLLRWLGRGNLVLGLGLSLTVEFGFRRAFLRRRPSFRMADLTL